SSHPAPTAQPESRICVLLSFISWLPQVAFQLLPVCQPRLLREPRRELGSPALPAWARSAWQDKTSCRRPDRPGTTLWHDRKGSVRPSWLDRRTRSGSSARLKGLAFRRLLRRGRPTPSRRPPHSKSYRNTTAEPG